MLLLASLDESKRKTILIFLYVLFSLFHFIFNFFYLKQKDVEPKLPLEVTSGDVIELPIAVVNNTNEDLSINRTLSIDKCITVKEKV